MPVELLTPRLRLRQRQPRDLAPYAALNADPEVMGFCPAFQELQLPEVVAFTAKLNLPSQAVMQRLGMVDAQEDFEHPGVPEGSLLRPHCLYRLSRARWAALPSAGGAA